MEELLKSFLKKFVLRHPVLGGIAFILLGLYALNQGFQEGARYAEFEGGSRVMGRVVSATEDPDRRPRYAAEVAWIAGGVVHRALIEVPRTLIPHEKARDPQRRLRPDSELRLEISKKNPAVAISAATLADAGLMKLAGRRTTSAALGGGLFLNALGLLFVLLRKRIASIE